MVLFPIHAVARDLPRVHDPVIIIVPFLGVYNIADFHFYKNVYTSILYIHYEPKNPKMFSHIFHKTWPFRKNGMHRPE